MSAASAAGRSPLDALALHLLIASLAFLLAYVSARLAGRPWSPDGGARGCWTPIAAGLLPSGIILATLGEWGRVAWVLTGCLVFLFAVGSALEAARLSGRWMLPAILVCCLALAGNGVGLTAVKLPFSARFFALERAALLASVLWLFLVAGLTTFAAGAHNTANGITLVTSVAFLCISLLQPQSGQPSASYLCAALAATAAGVGISRAPRLTVSLSASARAALGLSLGVVSLVGALKTSAFLVLVIPLLLLGVPLVDTAFLFVAPSARREREKGGRPLRLYQWLLAQGMSPSQVLVLFMLAAIYLGLLAILLVALIRVSFLLKTLLVLLFLPAGFLLLYGVYKVVAPVARRADEPGPEEVELFHVPVACLTEAQVLERVQQFIAAGGPHHLATCDALSLVRAQKDPEFLRILQQADLVTADGAGVVWAARMLGLGVPGRVSGVDLVDSVCGLAAQEGWSVYLLGARPGVAPEAAARLQERHPGLRIAGCHDGYFTAEQEPALLEEIRSGHPQILFVAMGVPKQDRWIHEHAGALAPPLAMGVGGSLDVISGRLPRSPEWMRRWGLEWLFRVSREPRRLPRLLALPKLVVLTLGAWLGRVLRDLFRRGSADASP